MRRSLLALVGLGVCACGGDEVGSQRDAATDAATGIDATIDAAVDAGVCDLSFISCQGVTPVVDRHLCDAATVLEPTRPVTGQDSALGGFGECARSASGIGGPSLYYRIVVPAQRVARVAVVPEVADTPGLVRALDGCGVAASTASGRGGTSTLGKAALCLRNDGAGPRAYVIAVSQYSGEAQCLPLRFGASLELRAIDAPCNEIE